MIDIAQSYFPKPKDHANNANSKGLLKSKSNAQNFQSEELGHMRYPRQQEKKCVRAAPKSNLPSSTNSSSESTETDMLSKKIGLLASVTKIMKT